MISTYSTITFEKTKIIIIIDYNKIIWFNAKQICISLKYKQPKMAIINNVEKEDDVFDNKIFNFIIKNITN